MDLHPGDVGRDRSRLQIVDYTRSRSPDQHDVIGKQGGIEAARQDVGGRNGPVAPRHCVVKPNPSGGVGRNGQRSDADRRQSGLLTEALLAVGARRTTDISGRAEGNA